MHKPIILDGKSLALEMQDEIKAQVAALSAQTGAVPTLATILVGSDPGSVMYVRMKRNACKRVGMGSRKVVLPETATTEELATAIRQLNYDPQITGILLQHPHSPQINVQQCFDAIAPEKDVDGVNSGSFGAMALQIGGYKSATAFGIMKLLQRYNIQIAGKNAVVIGRSPILGKPAALLLLNADATVTVCHSKTQDLPEIVRQADIVVAAVGKPLFVKADWVKEGAVVVDAGYNDGNIGDVDLEHVAPKTSAYTPVPGGVGPMTIITLMEQTLAAFRKSHGA